MFNNKFSVALKKAFNLQVAQSGIHFSYFFRSSWKCDERIHIVWYGILQMNICMFTYTL
jgi:hypothetical protein